MAEKLIQIAGSSRTPDEKIQAAIHLLDWFQVRAREFHTGDLSGFAAEMTGLYARLASEATTDEDLAGDLIDLVLAELGRRGFAPDPIALGGPAPA
ncbi:hypothetical protein SLNSH_22715 [Alsobacter soli]|uniref:Uncharacterized protein n=1 Tax=Alsobacter soli TaxID=2109933 RepID=A0A2T1HM24_9HYPH|nr:hypothetical protein [Alsobacter soli]PSC02678.1 hypothetical protein SLNSH_22715 [Alsobacter soli]